MTADGKTLRERIEACCPCRTGESYCRFRRTPEEDCGCQVRYNTDNIRSDGVACLWPGHALAEEAEELETSEAQAVGFADDFRGRAEAAEGLLAEAPDWPQGIAPIVWVREVYLTWLSRVRAATKQGETR
jgi:hypothetical protein